MNFDLKKQAIVTTEVELPNYHLTELIDEGYRTLVYRGKRKSDQTPVVIKLLKHEYPTFNELAQFRNQYTIAKNLDWPGIVRPYSLENHQNGYALVMPDEGYISLQHWLKNQGTLEISDFLAIAIQLPDILYGLYQNRVIHKDIKPANILIHPDTKQIQLIDFSIASLLPKETQEIQNPNVLEGTLAYLSPEQTGRMNRGIDYRTDFYSLGVTFYELLTGELPFQSDDPMELVHCHLAKPPIFPHRLPPTAHCLLDIVMKLMAKNAEDRYQSALGLKYDLEKCLYQWKETGKIESFELGESDLCDRFLIPEKLYGREAEIGELLAAFVRVASPRENPVASPRENPVTRGQEDKDTRGQGKTSPNLARSELILVAGFSGIGKTAVVNEVHKPIVRQRGYFIKGKFDQFQRNIPFSAFVQAFRDLMGQLLSETDAQIEQWKTQILSALGENGQVIIEVIPELERIIGKQPPVSELSGNAAQNRFNSLFGKFIDIFTTKDHPLVIFLDDLQWADSASLKLMQLLMSESESGYLLLIGAYRDNEVFLAHPLMLTLEEIEKSKATVNTITLSPLSQANLNCLVADTLSCSAKLAKPLTKLVYQKTKGNPFFATQFLKALHEEGAIGFDFEVGHWQCDLATVKALALTDDVVEFMALQLQKLPEATQDVLKLAACIGNKFDLETLAIVGGQSKVETAADLWKALQEELILPTSDVYKFYQDSEIVKVPQMDALSVTYSFLHDRVQQAAYFLIDEPQKQATHLKIGQRLWCHTKAEQLDERIFDLVNQLNIGIALISEQSERDRLAQLNLQAARKAKLSTAYEPAIQYLNSGLNLLAPESWTSNYQLRLDLSSDLIENLYLNSDWKAAQDLAESVLAQLEIPLDRIKIYELQILLRISQNQMNESIDLALQVLKMLGISLPRKPQLIQAEVDRLRQTLRLDVEQIAKLADSPTMDDPYQLAALRILSTTSSSCYIANPTLFPLVILTAAKLCIDQGHSTLAASAYTWYGALLCGGYLDIEVGYQFSKLALQLLQKFDAKEIEANVGNMFNVFVRPWKEHIQETNHALGETIQCGLDNGDIEYAFYGAVHSCNYHFFAGHPLEIVQNMQLQYADLISRAKYEFHEAFIQIGQQTIANLLGQSNDPRCLVGEYLDESKIFPTWIEHNIVFLLLCGYGAKTMLLYLFGDYEAAVSVGAMGKKYEQAAAGTLYLSQHNFYYSLALLATCNMGSLPPETLEIVRANQQKFSVWKKYAPVNYEHQYYLIEAEQYRVQGDRIQAIEFYDRAIAAAQENGYIQEKAIANEVAAKFYLEWGKETIAAAYLTQAYYGYARWGAKAKVDDLEQRYTQLLPPILSSKNEAFALNPQTEKFSTSSTQTVTSSSTSTSSVLDFATLMKASQTISEEIELDRVLFKLMQVISKNVGAQKCVLILQKSGNWVIEASWTGDSTGAIVLQSIPIEEIKEIPVKLIHYTIHTLETIAIDDATHQHFNDPYLLNQPPKSILCAPMRNQGKLVGIIYLENHLTTGAFTQDRLEIINLLTAQAAISIENAKLYQKSQYDTYKLEQSLQELQTTQIQLIQSDKMATIGQLVSGVAHEINNPVGFIAGNLTHAEDYTQDLMNLLTLYQENFPNPGEEIEAEIEEIELDYILDDLPQLMRSMKTGTQRIQEISKSMRTFSRSDSSETVSFDLHEGLDSTLMILKHRLKATDRRQAIEIVQNYGTLPEIEGYPGQLNQVFMNLISNAIEALEDNLELRGHNEETNSKFPIPTIWIRTESMNENWVKIQIADNGPGMTEDIKQRIFDHLFTTKAVGKGTGLGLSISRQIVEEKHGGQLQCSSNLGKGTEFSIKLPIQSP